MAQLRMNPAVIAAKRSGIREFMRMAAETPDCVSLTIGEPEFTTPQMIRESAKAALDEGQTHYIENNGSLALRRAISEFEREHSGLSYSENEIIVTAGATQGIFAALLSVLEPGAEAVVPTPAFGLYEEAVGLCAGKYVPMDTRSTGFEITPELLSQAISSRTRVIVLTSPNNPTGCVYGRKSLEAVREAVRGTGIFVLCDEVYRQLVYSTDYMSFSAFEDMRERVIVINAFSKPYAMTGWRAGYLMADAPVKREIEKAHQYMVVSTASFIQPACEAALKTDVGYMREAYRARLNYVCERLSKIKMEYTRPEGAFYVFPSIERFKMGSMEFCTRLLREAGLALTPGVCFGADNHVRISYCCSDDMLKKGMDRLECFIKTIE